MGADTEAVLTSVLGLDADEVAQLVADGVCRLGAHRVAEPCKESERHLSGRPHGTTSESGRPARASRAGR